MMNSKTFLKLIDSVLVSRANAGNARDTPKLFVLVISPELPLFVNIFRVHWYKELWFKKIK